MTFKNAGGVAHGVLSLRQALTVSSDVFFYQLGRDLNQQGDAAPALGARARAGAPHRHRPARRGARLHPGAEVARPPSTRSSSAAWTAPTPRRPRSHWASAVGRTGPGRWATTSTSPSARATCRPTRSRWRSPTARSPTAGGCCARGSGQRIENSAGQAEQDLEAPTAAQAQHRAREPLGDPRRPARRRQRAGRHLDAGVLDLPRRRSPARPERPRRAPAAPTSPGTSRWRPGQTPSTWSP